MSPEIISTIIQTSGTIIAASIGTGHYIFCDGLTATDYIH